MFDHGDIKICTVGGAPRTWLGDSLLDRLLITMTPFTEAQEEAISLVESTTKQEHLCLKTAKSLEQPPRQTKICSVGLNVLVPVLVQHRACVISSEGEERSQTWLVLKGAVETLGFCKVRPNFQTRVIA